MRYIWLVNDAIGRRLIVEFQIPVSRHFSLIDNDRFMKIIHMRRKQRLLSIENAKIIFLTSMQNMRIIFKYSSNYMRYIFIKFIYLKRRNFSVV